MKELLPDTYYILLSGYQEFEYVKKAMNLSVVDYLVKPVDKVELGNLLEKIAQQLQEKVEQSQTLSQELMRQDLRTTCQVKTAGGLVYPRKSGALLPFLTMFWDKIGRFSSLINRSMASS